MIYVLNRTFLLPVTLFFNPTRQPNMLARSPTTAVKSPIIPRDTKKQGHPPAMPAGGINANIIYTININVIVRVTLLAIIFYIY